MRLAVKNGSAAYSSTTGGPHENFGQTRMNSVTNHCCNIPLCTLAEARAETQIVDSSTLWSSGYTQGFTIAPFRNKPSARIAGPGIQKQIRSPRKFERRS